jgi:hypothetical protein
MQRRDLNAPDAHLHAYTHAIVIAQPSTLLHDAIVR